MTLIFSRVRPVGDTFKPPVTPLELSEWVVTGELIVSSDKEGQVRMGKGF